VRRLLIPIMAAVPILVAAATAWGVPPGAADKVDGSVQFGAVGNQAPAIEDKIYPANGGAAMTELTPLPITAGGTVTFNLDGPHQPLVYRLQDGESVSQAIDRLNLRAGEALPNPSGGAPVPRRRMAGQDPFLAPPPATASASDKLTSADRDFGFRYLSDVKAVANNVTPNTSPPLGAGTYILLCNVKAHYLGQLMRTTIAVAPNGPPA